MKRENLLLIASFLSLLISSCSSSNESDNNQSTMHINQETGTIGLGTPGLLQSRMIINSDLFAEVTIVAGSFAQTTIAEQVGNSNVWETTINVPQNVPFNITVTWYDTTDTQRLNLVTSTESFSAINSLGLTQLSSEFSDFQSEDFDADADSFTNLNERLNGTSPFDATTPGGDPVMPPLEDPPIPVVEGPPNPVVDGYEFINVGNGATRVISQSDDSDIVSIVQTVPITDSPVPVSIDTPITLFFNDQIFLDSLFNNFTVQENSTQIPGTVTITESSNGFAILTFIPERPYQEGSTVTLILNGSEQGVLDDNGNQLLGNSGSNFELSITTINMNSGTADTNLGFESTDEGVVFSGDGAVLSGEFGCLAAIEGNSFAAISTGNAIVSGNSALGGTSSTLQIGPITPTSGALSFSFNFASGEFQEFVGSEFDDSSVISVSGPGGSFTEILTTVNIVGTEGNSECIGIPALSAGDSDGYAGQIGWNDRVVDVSGLGSPLTITFTVTDVADEFVSSILAIDDIRF